MTSSMATREVARYYTETTPVAIGARGGPGAPDLSIIDREALAWQDRALCAETDPEVFFPEKGGSVRVPKRICGGCEVRAECLEYALETGQRFGIWGGLSERERRPLVAAREARGLAA
jgi:WhiB family redox-sensing transcriptional regulator